LESELNVALSIGLAVLTLEMEPRGVQVVDDGGVRTRRPKVPRSSCIMVMSGTQIYERRLCAIEVASVRREL